MILSLYRGFGVLGAPLIALYLARRRARGKEDPVRFSERQGIAGLPRPEGPLVWLHAASVGESLSLLALIKRLRRDYPGVTCLLTTGTVTSAALMAERLPEGVIHQYVPVDRQFYVRRFFDHWRPDLVLWSESEFWPNLITEPARRSIPLILINGRISPKSFSGWRRYPGLIRELLAGVTLCLGQTQTDVDRLIELGAPAARTVGNLKFSVEPLPVNEEELNNLSGALASRPRWFAASTHPGEEEILWAVHGKLQTEFPNLLTLIAPRHPDRATEIANRLRSLGAQVAQRSRHEPITPDTQIYLADTMGEMGLFFRLCDLVFMGKSLVNRGGQNPLEAANLGCTLLHGPHMWNFQEIIESMGNCGAACEVANGDALSDALGGFLKNPEKAQKMAAMAKAFVLEKSGVLDAVCRELEPFLKDLIKNEASGERA